MDFVPGVTVAGRYRLKRMVGAGGMGEVWLGEDSENRTRVAVKHLLPDAAKHHEVVARFKREAYLLGRVESPYIARVNDFFDDETYGLVLVMEFIEGPSLAHILEERTLSIEEAVDLGVDLLRALKDLHAVKIVHRDLKPGNIIMRPTPTGSRATVVDFGISRLLADKAKGESEVTGITRANIALGTVEYMAPEQILNSRDVTHVTDLYAVGIILFRAVKGHHAFGDRRGEELARAKLIEEPPELSTERSDAVATGLVAIVARALKKRPSQRYPSAVEMLGELEAVQRRAIENTELDDSTTDSGDTAVKPSPLATASSDGGRPLPVAAGRLPIRSSSPPSRSVPPRAPLRSEHPLGNPLAAGGGKGMVGSPSGAPSSLPPSGRSSLPSFSDAALGLAPGALAAGPTPVPASPRSDPGKDGGRGSHPSNPRLPSMAPARGSLASISEYSPPFAIAPPPPSELTSERSMGGLSKGTVALAVLTAFAVGTAVGLVIAPSSAPAGKTAESCAPCVSAAARETTAVTATADPVPTAPPAESAIPQSSSKSSASALPAGTGKPALKGSLSSIPTYSPPKTAAPTPTPKSDGLGEDEPPKPKPTSTSPVEL